MADDTIAAAAKHAGHAGHALCFLMSGLMLTSLAIHPQGCHAQAKINFTYLMQMTCEGGCA